ncbi:MAG: LuxR C-terminal-related transcriptional regulator [Planctomycetota bacterium]
MRSSRLLLADIRGMYRLLGDARELRDRPIEQDRVLADGLAKLVGCDQAFAARFDEFSDRGRTRPAGFVPGTDLDPNVARFGAWVRIGRNIEQDPMVTLTRGIKGHAAVSRSLLMPMEGWQDWDVYEAVVEPSRVGDCLVLWYRYPNSDAIRGWSIQRRLGEPDFNARETALLGLAAEEMAELHRIGRLEPPRLLEGLPPRLRELAEALTTEMSQKQIADAMGISYETLRSYAKHLYARAGVNGRESLIARMRG